MISSNLFSSSLTISSVVFNLLFNLSIRFYISTLSFSFLNLCSLSYLPAFPGHIFISLNSLNNSFFFLNILDLTIPVS